jgi:hypothetical protein
MDDAMWFHSNEATWRSLVDNDYWRAVKRDHQDVEQEMNALDRERIRTLTPSAFFTWLHDRYFFWKYTQPNRLATTRASLLKYQMKDPLLTRLGSIQRDLFAVRPNHVEHGLAVATQIPGLGVAGGSGLLAVLFPEWFGTVDQFVVDALFHVHDLPERRAVAAMHAKLFPASGSPGSLSVQEGATLIGIMQNQAIALNRRFRSRYWTPRKVDMALWGDRSHRG